MQGDGVDLEDLVHGSDAKVAIFSWNLQPELVERRHRAGRVRLPVQGAGRRGARARIEEVHAGEIVVPPEASRGPGGRGDWPGREFGLTAREAEIIALITQGLSNQEIAERSYLSINSVKTYIRTAYRKMGVTSRSAGGRWGIRHGFEPDRSGPSPRRGSARSPVPGPCVVDPTHLVNRINHAVGQPAGRGCPRQDSNL